MIESGGRGTGTKCPGPLVNGVRVPVEVEGVCEAQVAKREGQRSVHPMKRWPKREGDPGGVSTGRRRAFPTAPFAQTRKRRRVPLPPQT